jgi:alpha-glucosidase
MANEWWREAVFYQIYPRSFADSNGDGMGDLRGVINRIDYLKDLGIDALWLSPFFPSPQIDAGYDVSDYRDVDPLFGNLADFDELISACHANDIKVTIDLVPNHCSDQHVLFQAAIKAGPGSPERELFHFRDGRGVSGEIAPSNWTSAFGGPSWTRVQAEDGTWEQWYYHLFAPEQPDFNWEHPDVKADFEKTFRFWLDRGVDGFRIDVSDALIKDTSFADTDGGYPLIPKDDSCGVHDIYRSFRSIMNEYDGDRMAVVETGADDDIVALFIRPDEMHLAFNFHFLKSAWGADLYRAAITQSLEANREVGAPTTWVIDNHDNPRSVTRYASDTQLDGHYVPAVHTDLSTQDLERGRKRSRAAALLMLSLPGAVYIYNGQELELPNVDDLPDEVMQDPVFFRTEGKQRGRDGCRIPLPWESGTSPFGFGVTGSKPWLPMPAYWGDYAIAKQNIDPDSALNFYRHLIKLRKQNSVLRDGSVEILETSANPEVVEILRENDGVRVLVVVNFGDESYELSDRQDAKTLIASNPTDNPFEVAGNSAVVFKL